MYNSFRWWRGHINIWQIVCGMYICTYGGLKTKGSSQGRHKRCCYFFPSIFFYHKIKICSKQIIFWLCNICFAINSQSPVQPEHAIELRWEDATILGICTTRKGSTGLKIRIKVIEFANLIFYAHNRMKFFLHERNRSTRHW